MKQRFADGRCRVLKKPYHWSRLLTSWNFNGELFNRNFVATSRSCGRVAVLSAGYVLLLGGVCLAGLCSSKLPGGICGSEFCGERGAGVVHRSRMKRNQNLCYAYPGINFDIPTYLPTFSLVIHILLRIDYIQPVVIMVIIACPVAYSGECSTSELTGNENPIQAMSGTHHLLSTQTGMVGSRGSRRILMVRWC